MQTITLKVADEAVDKVLELLSHLPKKQVEVIAPKTEDVFDNDDVVPMDKLAGCLSHYVTEKVSDEQIEEAITQGIYERAMAGKGQQ